MKVYIPKIDEELTLAKEWIFMLYGIWQNETFTKAYSTDADVRYIINKDEKIAIDLPKGTTFIYRKMKSGYVYLTVKECPNKKLKHKRLVVKLQDANRIEFE